MNEFIKKICNYYHINQEEYDVLAKALTLEDLPSFLDYKDIKQCANYIHDAINNNVKTLIYGDYDCDGVMGISILYLALKTSEWKPGYYIPFRETDGYGLTKDNIDKFYGLGYRLIILVDNGISLIEEVEYANSLGIEIIIMDHHSMLNEVPKAKYILHPSFSNFSKVNMCGGSVAFFFSIAYLGYVDEYLLTLAMISTISDMMELIEKNRIIAKLGLQILNKNKYNNILLLIDNGSLEITENDISMSLVPRVNAIGRIINNNSLFNIVKYFIEPDNESFIKETAEWIKGVNKLRKDIVSDFSNKELNIDIKKSSIVVVSDELKEGISGLVASKLMNEYEKPTAVLTCRIDDKNEYKGSLRSKYGFDIRIILDDLKDILVSFGGHENAGGLTIKKENIEEFKKRFEIASEKHKFEDDKKELIEINFPEITKENYDSIRKIAPFGQGFSKPEFVIRNIYTNFLSLSRDGKHIITKINPQSSLVYFNYDKTIFDYKTVDLIGSFEINCFKNVCTIQFRINKFTKNI